MQTTIDVGIVDPTGKYTEGKSLDIKSNYMIDKLFCSETSGTGTVSQCIAVHNSNTMTAFQATFNAADKSVTASEVKVLEKFSNLEIIEFRFNTEYLIIKSVDPSGKYSIQIYNLAATSNASKTWWGLFGSSVSQSTAIAIYNEKADTPVLQITSTNAENGEFSLYDFGPLSVTLKEDLSKDELPNVHFKFNNQEGLSGNEVTLAYFYEVTPTSGTSSTSGSSSSSTSEDIGGLPWWAWTIIGGVLLLLVAGGIGFFFYQQKASDGEDEFYDVQNEKKLKDEDDE